MVNADGYGNSGQEVNSDSQHIFKTAYEEGLHYQLACIHLAKIKIKPRGWSMMSGEVASKIPDHLTRYIVKMSIVA